MARGRALNQGNFSLPPFLQVEDDDAFHDIANDNLVVYGLNALRKSATNFAVMCLDLEVVSISQIQGVNNNPVVDTQDQVFVILSHGCKSLDASRRLHLVN